jgi:predicted nucleic acid-binding protein
VGYVIAVDANMISALLRGENVEMPAEVLFIPYVVVAELRSGTAAGDKPRKNQSQLDTFFADDNLTTSPGLPPEVIACYAQIYTYLRKQGTPISPSDLWIAAECMHLSLPLLTRDQDFRHVPQVILA